MNLHLQQRIAGATININGEAAKRINPKAPKIPKPVERGNIKLIVFIVSIIVYFRTYIL
jgi:hypothetical protein